MISGQGVDCVPTYSSSSREGWQPGKFWRRAGVMGGVKGRPAAAVPAARRDFAVARTKPTVKATSVGSTAPASRMLPSMLLVMAATVLPSVAGWGPREGVAASVFGAAGLGAQRGVATAVVYGLMMLVASLPGAAVLIVAWFRRARPPGQTQPPLRKRPAHA